VLTARLVEQAAPVICARVGRVELDCLVEILERLVVAAGQAVDLAAPDIGAVVIRIDLDGARIVGDGGRVAAR
jgi:hypothetical protein